MIVVLINEKTMAHRVLQGTGKKAVEVTNLFEIKPLTIVDDGGRVLDGFFIGQHAETAKAKAKEAVDALAIRGKLPRRNR